MQLLPDQLWLEIIAPLNDNGLSVSDIAGLNLLNHQMHSMLFRIRQKLWQRLVERDLFTTLPLCRCLTEAWNDPAVSTMISSQFPEPGNWYQFYCDTLLIYRLESTCVQTEDDRNNRQATRLTAPELRLQKCRDRISLKNNGQDGEILTELLSIINADPSFIPAYHLLASFCYVRNHFKAALRIIEGGQRAHLILCNGNNDTDDVDDSMAVEADLFDETLEEMRAEILDRLSGKSPLLVPIDVDDYSAEVAADEDGKECYALSPRLESILIDVFNRFDTDCDGYLNYDELAALLAVINGSNPVSQSWRPPITTKGIPCRSAKPVRKISKFLPLPMFLQLVKRYRCENDAANGLSVQGFLAFYLEQTSQDAAETFRDLTQLGYGVAEMFISGVFG